MAWEVEHNAGFVGRNWIVTCFPKAMIYPFLLCIQCCLFGIWHLFTIYFVGTCTCAESFLKDLDFTEIFSGGGAVTRGMWDVPYLNFNFEFCCSKLLQTLFSLGCLPFHQTVSNLQTLSTKQFLGFKHSPFEVGLDGSALDSDYTAYMDLTTPAGFLFRGRREEKTL